MNTAVESRDAEKYDIMEPKESIRGGIAMKQAVIVTGHLAALKSTVSKRLATDLSAVCLNKDDIKEILGDAIGFTTREENLALSFATFLLQRKLMKDVLGVDNLVILESNFRKNEFELLKADAIKDGIRLIVVFMTGDPDVLYERYATRQPTRHPVHTSTGLLPPETYRAILAPFDPVLYGSDAIVVDTTVFAERDYADVLSRIRDRLLVR